MKESAGSCGLRRLAGPTRGTPPWPQPARASFFNKIARFAGPARHGEAIYARRPAGPSVCPIRTRARLKFHPLRGIDVHAIDIENPMQVRAGGPAGRTGITENVPALHLQAGGRDEFGHVQIHGFEALAMVEAYGVAEHMEGLCE